MAKVGFISFRLGGTDGVSVVASQWMDAFVSLGYEVVTIAGHGEVDHVIPSLAIESVITPTTSELQEALRGLDLVVVENLLSIPMHLEASLLLAEVLRGRNAIIHHHDPPWQRANYQHITDLPVDDPDWLHVSINHAMSAEFAERGITTSTIWNSFTPPAQLGDPDLLRKKLGVNSQEILVLHPVRAIARKNIPAALEFCEQIGATYWLQGKIEEGYETTLENILANAKTKVIRTEPTASLDNAYAACNLVVFSSLQEGFGNPPFEAALHRRLAVVADYSVLKELETTGISFLKISEPQAALEALRSSDSTTIDRNEQIVRSKFSPARLRLDLEALLSQF